MDRLKQIKQDEPHLKKSRKNKNTKRKEFIHQLKINKQKYIRCKTKVGSIKNNSSPNSDSSSAWTPDECRNCSSIEFQIVYFCKYLNTQYDCGAYIIHCSNENCGEEFRRQDCNCSDYPTP
jgi:hypothetical protein